MARNEWPMVPGHFEVQWCFVKPGENSANKFQNQKLA